MLIVETEDYCWELATAAVSELRRLGISRQRLKDWVDNICNEISLEGGKKKER